MTTNTELIDRLLRYMKIDTQSDEEAASQPSTLKRPGPPALQRAVRYGRTGLLR